MDILVFLTQLIFHNLFGVVNEKDVFEIKQVNEENGNDEVDEDERIYDEGDGYNGMSNY